MFKAHDYESVYLEANMAHIVFVYVPVILLFWILALIKDMLVQFINWRNDGKERKRIRSIFMLKRHEPWMHNFVNRFIYETFFELCFCSLISI